MSSARRLSWWVALMVLLLVATGCSRGSAVATLAEFTGGVNRDHVGSVGSWEATEVGAKFVIGEGIRTSARSTATLRLFDKHRLSLEPSTVLRFLERPSDPKHARVALEMGQVTLQAAEGGLELETELGMARIAPRGQVRLTHEGDSTRLEVLIGSAELLRHGEHWELAVGDAVDIRFEQPLRRGSGGAPSTEHGVAEAAPLPSASSAAEAASAEPADSATPAGDGALTAKLSRGPERVDLIVRAGDSLVIHDPHPPTAVRMLAGGRCPAGTLLTIDPGRAKPQETIGDGDVAAQLGRGSHRYAVRCLKPGGERGEKVGEGTISVITDSGSRQLAKTAPATEVETDGRRYTVLYQSLLPRISVRWPGAPAAANYTLHVTSPNGSRTFLATGSARYAFSPGALVEGDHVLSFEAGAASSRPTQLAIRFDNAAPTASIASPAEGGFSPGQSVLVAGTALPGWTVSVGGETLSQDTQNRFSATLAAPAGLGALAIRFAQPQRGVHYYLRRSAH